MTPEERRRAGGAVAERMTELGLTAPRLARKAGVDPTTVRALIKGTRWINDDTRERIAAALEWPPGEIARRVWGGPAGLEVVSVADLVEELCRRLGHGHHAPDTGILRPHPPIP